MSSGNNFEMDRKQFQMAKTILYLGMADDILTILDLFPNFETLYVIDKHENGYYKSLEKQRELIRYSILTGCDEKTKLNYEEYEKIKPYKIPNYKAEILKDELNGNRWEVEFVSEDKARKLIRFYDDFSLEWPKEICNLDVILGFGAFAPITKMNLRRGFTQDEWNEKNILKMFKQRTNKPFFYSSIWFGHEHLQYRYTPSQFQENRGDRKEDRESVYGNSLQKCYVGDEIFDYEYDG